MLIRNNYNDSDIERNIVETLLHQYANAPAISRMLHGSEPFTDVILVTVFQFQFKLHFRLYDLLVSVSDLRFSHYRATLC